MELSVDITHWPTREPFVISRGSIDHVEILSVEVRDGDFVGRGESAPQAFMGQSCEAARDALLAFWSTVGGKADRNMVNKILTPSSARNALDCALWDLEAKQSGKSIWDLTGISKPANPLQGGMTVSLGDPADMGRRAARDKDYGLLKIKLGAGDMRPHMQAVRDAAPNARLIVDLNEAWTMEDLAEQAPFLAELGVEMIEQPLLHGGDEALIDYKCPLPLAADESCSTRTDLDFLKGRYDFVNIKLDKTGGLTEALALAEEAKAQDFGLMVGCMVATSLAMAPGFVIGALCEYCDLDGAALLAEDRTPGLRIEGGDIYPFDPALWG